MILARLSACFLIGIWLGAALGLSHAWLAGAALCVCLAGLLPPARAGRQWLLMLAALLVGLARAPVPHSSTDPAYITHYAGGVHLVSGIVSGEPDIRDSGTEILVQVRSVATGAKTHTVAGSVSVRLPRAIPIESGDLVSLTGRLESQSAGISSRADARMLYPKIQVTGHAAALLSSAVSEVRHRLTAGIDRWLPEPEASLLIAIALGSRASQLAGLAPALVATGLIHIIAISGVKVALVAGSIYGWARRTGNRPATLLVGLSALGLYVELTGGTASGERSALMWMLVFLAAYLGRPTVALLSLSLVAALMVVLDPPVLWDVGFQMSTLGTFGIVALTGPISRVLARVPSPWREALGTTIAAQVATVPIVAATFHAQSLVGPLANALVLPLLPVLILLGFALGTVATVSWLAGPLALLAQALLDLVVAVARSLAHAPLQLAVTSVSTWWTVLYLLLLGTVAAWLLGRERWAPRREWLGHGRELSMGAWAASASLAMLVWQSPHQLIRVEAVGSGPALLLRDRSSTVLIGGSPHPAALLERLGRLLPLGDRTIDAVVVPDPRSADLAGLSAVVSHYRVHEVLDARVEYPTSTYAQWRDQLLSNHIPQYALDPAAEVYVPDGSISVLGPVGTGSDPRGSVGIVKVSLKQKSLLLAGRASAREQREIVFEARSLRSSILVRDPAIPLDPVFARAVHASVVAKVGEFTNQDKTLSD